MCPIIAMLDYFGAPELEISHTGQLQEGTLMRHYQFQSGLSIRHLAPQDFRDLNNLTFMPRQEDYQSNELTEYPRRRYFRR